MNSSRRPRLAERTWPMPARVSIRLPSASTWVPTAFSRASAKLPSPLPVLVSYGAGVAPTVCSSRLERWLVPTP